MGARDRLRKRQSERRNAMARSGGAGYERPSASAGWSRPRLQAAFEKDECFQVMTVDGLHWIDPFTRKLVPAAFDWKEAALAWLMEHKPWREQPKLLNREALHRVRWASFIREQLNNEQRLKYFVTTGHWLNPLDGNWVAGVKLHNGQVNKETLLGMATAMAKAEIATNSSALQDVYVLRAKYDRAKNEITSKRESKIQEQQLQIDSGAEHDVYNQGAMRISGRRASSKSAGLKPVKKEEPAPSESSPVKAQRISEDISSKQLEEMRGVGYLIGDCIGRGGMGAVYKAVQISLEREVALKVRTPGDEPFSKFVERFLREAKLVAKIAHPNVVAMFDVGRTNSLVYMAMEFLGGGDVDQKLEQMGRLPEQHALRYLGDALSSLGAIHGSDLIHRDIKTANLFLTDDDRVKIGDLGIARDVQHERHLTNPNAILGTPAFMPPEQSVPGGSLDARSDLYSIGVTMFHMLTGQLPFDDSNPLVILRRVITEDVPSVRDIVPEISEGTAALVAHLMAKAPEDRPQNCLEALAELEPLLNDE